MLAKYPPPARFLSLSGGTAPSAVVKGEKLGRRRRPIFLITSAGS